MKDSLRIAVLMGGPSEEHGISLKSGQGVAAALRRRRWIAEPVVIPQDLSVQDACGFVERALHQLDADVVFIALHGAFGEDGTIQRLCEDLHLAYTGSDALASRLGMDKEASRRRFQAAGLKVPDWQVVDLRQGSAWAITAVRAYPLVVKPTNQGSSLGVSIVRREEELEPAMVAAGRYGDRVLIEEFVAGRELTVGVLGEEPLPVVEIRPSQPFFNYAAKYTMGATEYVVPAVLPPATAQMAQAAGLAAHQALGCRHLSRTDMILNRDDVPVILEVNTIPGFTPTSLLPKAAACIEISYEELCERLVMMAWQVPAPLT
ncbi:MAG: D-alanine--D-alanine ligase [Candidatus Omnitrophica bacterium]|nr:D-alanine--D-alanine ligase [Candidatus Omnitrophota bacterium]MBI3020433.1 D-alanine--D-alanine ligase [Candidatus Omnitrophota bacterium]